MRADLQRDAQGRCEPQPVREAFERLFEKHGLRGAIRSDNGNAVCGERGAAGRSRLSAWWRALVCEEN